VSQWRWNEQALEPDPVAANRVRASGEAAVDGVNSAAGVQSIEAPASTARAAAEARELDERTQWLHQRLIRQIDPSVITGGKSREAVEAAARELLRLEAPQITGEEKEEVISLVVDEVAGFGPIDPLLRDLTISEVMVNSPDLIYYERDRRLYESSLHFRDDAHILRVIERIIAPIGRRVNEASPMVDARLPDGSRVNVIVPPLAPDSPIITIRKFRTDRFGIDDLVLIGSLPREARDFLGACVRAKVNMVVSGGTGSGKTTLLNALSALIPAGERIVTIEDPLELRLQQRHVVRLEARPAGIEGRGEVTQRDLFRNSLRMRPDRILVGEVRGAEAFDMLQAMNTGHEGSLTTLHANSPRDALARIENMVMLAGFDIPLRAIREQLASALNLVVQLTRMPDGSRRLTHVTEVAGMEGDTITTQDVFRHVIEGTGPDGKVTGHFEATGVRPRVAEKLEAFGFAVRPDTFIGGRRFA
jgi:pilus assembly protein CpaF